ncbi:regulator of G protein signaling domain protein [Rhizoctonia solani]|uniref:Regulator of G protein signaling domain protein n=1 Tax=Rhizoctonia solani TaxID=456999 RepID=A0A8H8PCW7_9AGAM|nr:regulator of G protein signaling domain protein [Rhizoctonia solani]QRW27773.1 regulator of G protein signaling domain protein [Rhizoctonia solani]
MARPPVTLNFQSDKINDGEMSASTAKASPSVYPPPINTNTPPRSTLDNSIPPRPRPYVFSGSTLLDIPSRLARPPSVKSVGKQWTSQYKSRKFALVFQPLPPLPLPFHLLSYFADLVPEMSVSLDEILAMRHLSPLSLKDFEQYLLFEEYGAENLYFLLWLNDYAALYHAGNSPLRLYHSLVRAKATFFSSDSQYELNLAAETPAPPHPDAFAAIRTDVEVMLRTSARRFVKSRSRNAGTQRVLCVIFGGLLTMAIALAPLMVSHFSERNRYIRFGMIPPLWLGLTVFLCSANGVCLILYLMGGSRQLHPFELVRPAISAPVPREPQSPYQASFTTIDTSHDVKGQPLGSSFVQYPNAVHSPQQARAHVDLSSRPDVYVLPRIRPGTPIMESAFEFETAGFIPSQDDDDTATMSDHASTYVESTIAPSASAQTAGARSSVTKFNFDFDALPSKTLNSTSGPPTLEAARGNGIKRMLTKVAGPVTRVSSPVISRAQWEVVIRSMVVAALFALIVSGILVAVPI